MTLRLRCIEIVPGTSLNEGVAPQADERLFDARSKAQF
jgi:hypothetical protein